MSAVIRKGVRAVICCGKLGAVPDAAAADGKVKHVVLVSAAGVSKGGGGGGVGGLLAAFGGEEARRKDPKREVGFVVHSLARSLTHLLTRFQSLNFSRGAFNFEVRCIRWRCTGALCKCGGMYGQTLVV